MRNRNKGSAERGFRGRSARSDRLQGKLLQSNSQPAVQQAAPTACSKVQGASPAGDRQPRRVESLSQAQDPIACRASSNRSNSQRAVQQLAPTANPLVGASPAGDWLPQLAVVFSRASDPIACRASSYRSLRRGVLAQPSALQLPPKFLGPPAQHDAVLNLAGDSVAASQQPFAFETELLQQA